MKKIILLLMMIILTGCTIEYDVYFYKDYSMTDDIRIKEDYRHFVEVRPDNWNDIVYSRLHSIKLIDEYDEDIAYYDIKLSKDYLNYKEYFEGEYFKQYVGNFSEIKKDGKIEFKIVFNEAFTGYVYGENGIRPYVDDIKINATIPFNVIDSNADEVKDNVYSWVINGNNKPEYITVTINNPEEEKEENKSLFNFTFLFIIAIVVILIMIVICKNKKNNAL